MSEPVLELTNATVVRDDRRILDNLTLTIQAGEHTAIVGPNGAGKSFLTRLLSHDERPLVPENGGPPPIRVFGSDNWDVFTLRSQLGIVSAEMHSKFVMGNNEGRVRGDAAVLSGFLASQGILRYGAVTPEMRTRAAEALAKMGASHLASRWLDAMSSGEARRVLLARALVTDPRALVLDEPTTSLDLAARHEFMERVRQIARDGTTLILVTHHIEEIIPEIERIVLLKHGRIVANGAKRSVLTADALSDVFESPIALIEEDGYYYARPAARPV
jgi:iron complex transport system ATP-binding protein